LIAGASTSAGANLPQGTLTFLLSDVESSTRLWEQYQDAMAAALGRHDEIIEHLVADHHGVLVRPRGEGDSRFAVFSDATHAVHAACAIQVALSRESWPLPEPLRIRVGLHTGATDIRAGDYYGSTVNRCARLRDLAQGSQVLCSAATAGLARASLPAGARLRSLGSHRLRGLREPETVFQLVHAAFAQQGTRLEPTESALPAYVPAYPFPMPRRLVGRGAELAALKWVLARGQGSAQTVFIGAPAGTGKSTLVGTLARQASEDGVLVLAGGCFESEALIPLRPFRDALADYLLTRSADVVRAEVGDLANDLAAIVPELRHHLNLAPQAHDSQAFDQTRIFGAVHSLLRAIAQRTPVLLCLEDLHVADALTLDLIQYVTRHMRRLPIVLVATLRSDEVQPGGALAHLLTALTRDGAERIELGGLERADTALLTASLLERAPSQRFVDALFTTTEGNPLFVEQLVLALREEHGREDWHSVTEISGPTPSVIGDVLLRRFDRLTASCRDTLALIATFGHSVDHETLVALVERRSEDDRLARSELDLLTDLDEALGARVLRETAGEYAFAHALLREAVYSRLSSARRALLHARAAQTQERLAGSHSLEHAAELAHHFARSGPDPAMRAKALQYSIAAGRQAAALSSHNAALAHAQQAWRIVETTRTEVDATVRLEVLELLGEAECNVGLWSACIGSYTLVLHESPVALQRARAQRAIGRSLEQLGQPSAALAAYAAGLTELGDSLDRDSVRARLQFRYDEAFCHLLTGRFRFVQQLGQELLDGAVDLGDLSLIARANNVVASAHMWQGQFDAATEHYTAAMEAAQRNNETSFLAVVHENLGANCFYSGRMHRAESELTTAIGLYQESVSELRAVLALQILSRVWAAQGEFTKALATIARARELAAEGHDRWAAECLSAEGEINFQRGAWANASACFSGALALHEQVGHTSGIVEASVGLGTAAERAGDLPVALEHYRRAADVVAAIDPSFLTVAAKRHLGVALLRSGQLEEAAAQLEACLKLAATMPQSLEFAPSLLAIAELARMRSEPSAMEYAQLSSQAASTPESAVLAQHFIMCLALQDHLVDDARQAAGAALAIAERHPEAWFSQLVRDDDVADLATVPAR